MFFTIIHYISKVVKSRQRLISILFNPFDIYKYITFYFFYDFLFDKVNEGTLRVYIPDFLGSFEIQVKSHILKKMLCFKQYEPELIDVAKRYIDPKKDILDIGSNIGLYSVLFSQIISNNNRVLSIEPTPMALKFLIKNIKNNRCQDSIIIFDGVATDIKGEYQLKTISGMEEYSSLKDIVHPAVKDKLQEIISVKGDTIDDLVDYYDLTPGFIKIDVEGAEYLVLKGAINTIKRYKPIILSELSDTLLASFGAASSDILDILENNGYNIFNAYDMNTAIKSPYNGEIIAIPEEHPKTINLTIA